MLKKIPNILTIGRIIIVPFFVLAFYLPGFYGDLTALILFEEQCKLDLSKTSKSPNFQLNTISTSKPFRLLISS